MRESNHQQIPTHTVPITSNYQVLAVLNDPYTHLSTLSSALLLPKARHNKLLPGRGRAAAEIGPGPPPSSYLLATALKPLSKEFNTSYYWLY